MSCVSWINYKRTPMEVIPQWLFISFFVILDELYIDIKKVLTMYKMFCIKQKTKNQNIYYYQTNCVASVLTDKYIIVTAK